MKHPGPGLGVGNRAMRRAAQRDVRRAQRRAARRRRHPLHAMALRLATATALLAMTTTSFGRTGVQAASFEVTNLDDSGAGSLRRAIEDANALAGPDVITFAPGLTGTITLTTGQLSITDSLQIVGPGRSALTLDGNAASRVIDIPVSPGVVDVTISGVTISNGRAATGAGIQVRDELLTLDDVAITGNVATGDGGGLHADGFGLTLTVRDSVISGNTGLSGGGVYVEDTGGITLFDGAIVDGNVATDKGGGIYLYDPDNDVVITDSTITGNTAARGGGIYLYSMDAGSLTISGSTISGNTATTGGGVYLYNVDRPTTISGTTISGNTATTGAGINIDRISAPATITNSTISGNTATGEGGGVRLARGSGLTITHSTITANSAGEGGGARFPGAVTLSHTIVAGNTATTTADLHAVGGASVDFSVLGEVFGAVTDGGGTQTGVADPGLGPLADNGGSTRTHLPLVTGPALDTGDPAAVVPATDQRGQPRVDGTIDIGAVEAQRGTVGFDTITATIAENAGTLTVTVTRAGAADLAATVQLATANGTAIAPADYGSVSTTLSWAAGETGPKTATVPVVLDAAHESDEAFTVGLSSPSGAALGTNASLAVTLQNSNTPPTIAAIDDVSTPLGAALPTIDADIADTEQPATALVVTATSSNTAVVADSGIVVGGSGASRTLDITPLAVGFTTITVVVSDGVSTATETFTVTVTAAPPPPTTTPPTTTPPTTTPPTTAPPTTAPPTTTPAPPPPTTGLPQTGSSFGLIATLASGLTLLGGALVMGVRQRRSKAGPSTSST